MLPLRYSFNTYFRFVIIAFLYHKARLAEATKPMHAPPVVVVGGGLAGLSAALSAAEAGSEVVLVDKEGSLGGNSQKATSGINACSTTVQSALGIEDSVASFRDDILRSGQGLTDPTLATMLAADSASAMQYLIRDLGLRLSEVVMSGGHSVRRTHRFPPASDGKPIPMGFTVCNAFKKKIENHPLVSIRTNTRVVDISFLERKTPVTFTAVEGVVVADTTGKIEKIPASAVVLTAGGYAAERNSDDGLLRTYTGHLVGFPTTNGDFSTGDLVKIGLRQNITTVHLDQVQLHPTGFVSPKEPDAHRKFLCPEVFRGMGSLLLTKNGERFVNELGRRNEVAQAILKYGSVVDEWGLCDGECRQKSRLALMLLTPDMAHKVGDAAISFYKKLHLLQDVPTLDALATLMGAHPESLRSTLDNYENARSGMTNDPFNKTVFSSPIDKNGPFVVGYVTPALHYTMGGLKINAETQLTKDGTVVPNLFAAGENAGGLHGANRLGGNGLLESLVFGRRAGSNAARVSATSSFSPVCGVPLTIREVHEETDLRLSLPNLMQFPTEEEVGKRVALVQGEQNALLANGTITAVAQGTVHISVSEVLQAKLYPSMRVIAVETKSKNDEL